jgi:hypothetical protein
VTALTVLAGGGALYVFRDITDPAVARLVAEQRAVIDVAYPAGDTVVQRIPEHRWPDVQQRFTDEGFDVVDCRELGPQT